MLPLLLRLPLLLLPLIAVASLQMPSATLALLLLLPVKQLRKNHLPGLNTVPLKDETTPKKCLMSRLKD